MVKESKGRTALYPQKRTPCLVVSLLRLKSRWHKALLNINRECVLTIDGPAENAHRNLVVPWVRDDPMQEGVEVGGGGGGCNGDGCCEIECGFRVVRWWW